MSGLLALALLVSLSGEVAVALDLTPALRAEIAPTGTLRAAINYGNPVLAQRGADGAPAGVSADLARELGRRLGVPVAFETFDTAGHVVAALGGPRTWDVAFLAVDPERGRTIAFSPPYVIIEGAYLVRTDSALTANDEVDRAGIRIAVGRNTAYDLFLGRHLQAAERIYAPTSADALTLFLDAKPDVLASVRQPLESYVKTHPGLRILPGRFMVIEQTVATPKERAGSAAYMRAFIETMKASGFVAEALAASGQHDAVVAPAAP
ncbi:transporter substrate-binding domain-containing protein [Methylobacterium sp. J-068]|uniref:transporter substrate-binding domain-containing protein n=1 Tax=Methylobacterium sp. J-068 TaxID=2836649 RepID=UPI001FB8B231|nr:transporter substrate-binding domain-containing protein [Methylobacterium sp. J-068]MCJ2034309.1 transporter substrate-binding domain-containing protein [Methylobacterium sp. J-068]